MKLVQISCCDQCLHSKQDMDTGDDICKKQDRIIKFTTVIPRWCPLPDAVSDEASRG